MNTFDPAGDAHQPFLIVEAAAGSGKTHLLVERIVALLASGAAPGGILAISFTTKAAAELRDRVHQRLHQLALDPSCPAERAGLYETVLDALPSLRIGTFHAFCQDLLTRFALHADVPPGFELLEEGEALIDPLLTSWAQGLRRDAVLFACFERLLERLGLHGTRGALKTFVAHRADWWAFIESAPDPLAHAEATLADTLQLAAPAPRLDADFRAKLQAHAQRLGRDKGVNCQTQATAVAALLTQNPLPVAALWGVFFNDEGTTRRLAASIAKDPIARADFDAICPALDAAEQDRRRRACAALSADWVRLGADFLAYFQAHKRKQNQLDFTDLEWQAYRLLRAHPQADWIQYKLDRRIDHLLIDEFQDTNPTQWQLVLPLLQEIAAGAGGRTRSACLVGDPKQSIYRFRRAAPALLGVARDWLAQHAGAATLTQTYSWRSAQAVIDCVNAVFGGGELPDFLPHATHRTELWGRVELLPLIEDTAKESPTQDGARDPLTTPRYAPEDSRYVREGERLAECIATLVGTAPILDGGKARALRYDDVLVLMRDRLRAEYYEFALRKAGIPYIMATPAPYFAALEVQDIYHLLRALIAPGDDLALASALRSPVFAASDAKLATLAQSAHAQSAPSWWQAMTASDDPWLLAACARLRAWTAMADTLPVHDLLDRIMAEADVEARYLAAAPAHLHARVRRNLRAVLDLALSVDSGRYPTIAEYLARLREACPPEQAPLASDGVRLMTIHGAKGLEAPVVFLLDAAGAEHRERGVQPFVEWPAEDPRPRHFFLVPKTDERDSRVKELLAHDQMAAARERLNLLYVALTRAKQYLFVSGCRPRQSSDLGWWGFVATRLAASPSCRHDATSPDGTPVVLANGTPPSVRTDTPSHPEVTIDPRLWVPIDAAVGARMRPSDVDIAQGSAHARRLGRAWHRALQLASRGDDIAPTLKREYPELSAELETLPAEVDALVRAPGLQWLFARAAYAEVFEELPLSYLDAHGRSVFGIADRVMVGRDEVVLVDFKTHAGARAENLAALSAPYRSQMRQYARGLAQLWPARRIRALLLFTACAACYEFGADDLA